jgi:hypothetical protein
VGKSDFGRKTSYLCCVEQLCTADKWEIRGAVEKVKIAPLLCFSQGQKVRFYVIASGAKRSTIICVHFFNTLNTLQVFTEDAFFYLLFEFICCSRFLFVATIIRTFVLIVSTPLGRSNSNDSANHFAVSLKSCTSFAGLVFIFAS